MTSNLRAWLIRGVFATGLLSTSPAMAQDHKAWIETELTNGYLTAQVHIQAGHDALLEFRLTSVREAHGSHASTTQTNRARLKAGEERTINQLRLGTGSDARYQLVLELYEDGERVAVDQISYP